MGYNFERYAREAEDKGERKLARRLRDEGRMASALVRCLLAKGCLLSLSDGEEWVVNRSGNKDKVMSAMFTTDEDKLLARDQNGKKLGFFWLVYGNSGEELVADYSDNEFCNAVWAELEATRDAIEAGR
jgi:hypothetical protein